MTKQLFIVCCYFVCLCCYGLEPQQPSKVIQYPVVEPNVSFLSVTQLATATPNLKYAYGENQYQYAELWLPQMKNNRLAPIVVLIHGGCWLNAFDIKHTYAMSTALTMAGYAVWSLEYRRTGDDGGGWPGTFDDVKNAIQHLGTIKDQAIDLQNVALVGHSAGGHLALWYGAQNLPDATRLNIKGVVGLAAIVDLETYAQGANSCQTATTSFMGGPPQKFGERYAQANPTKLSLHPSSRLIHGTEDKLVPLEQAKNSKLPTEWVQGAGHFDLIHPGSIAWQKLLGQLEALLQ